MKIVLSICVLGWLLMYLLLKRDNKRKKEKVGISMNTSMIVSASNSFLHCSISAHICFAFSMSNFLALKNLYHHSYINELS
jgi:hypothetical protein